MGWEMKSKVRVCVDNKSLKFDSTMMDVGIIYRPTLVNEPILIFELAT